ncbi:MAG: endonuclease/exonuclease/phosphatase, partial [SAR202 cluster bacterium]|nr:endonuclease/exonuclease/phosphatase [SAR202 cluster bacterium]
GPYASKYAAYMAGTSRSKPRLRMPMFLTFIRQPFCVSFRIAGNPGTKPYEFMAVNAHLYFGDYISDRRQEFDALMDWITERVVLDHRAYYPNFLLLGDLNLDYDNPNTDRARIEPHLKTLNNRSGDEVNVYFPFLDPHPDRTGPFRTNARMSETFDQIGLFSRDSRLPTFEDNSIMGQDARGPDYGVFNFVELFSQALLNAPFESLTGDAREDFLRRFQHKVSDHMPLWIRLPMPE